MPIPAGNPMNAPRAGQLGNHRPAQIHRHQVYKTTKSTMDKRFVELDQKIPQWSEEESQAVKDCLDLLAATMADVNPINHDTKAANREALALLNDIPEDVWGDSERTVKRQLDINNRVVVFLAKLKYQTILTLQHKLKLLNNQGDARRTELGAYMTSVNDMTEVMSGTFLEKALKEKFARANKAEIEASVRRLTRAFKVNTAVIFVFVLCLIYRRIIPPFIVVYIARLFVRLAGENL